MEQEVKGHSSPLNKEPDPDSGLHPPLAQQSTSCVDTGCHKVELVPLSYLLQGAVARTPVGGSAGCGPAAPPTTDGSAWTDLIGRASEGPQLLPPASVCSAPQPRCKPERWKQTDFNLHVAPAVSWWEREYTTTPDETRPVKDHINPPCS